MSAGISNVEAKVESSASLTSNELLSQLMNEEVRPEAVWYDDECECGVKLPSDAVTKESSSVERECQS